MGTGTGHKTTIAFGTSAFTALFKALDFGEMVRGALDASHLDTTNFKDFLPEDLVDPGDLEGMFLYDPDTDALPPVNGDPEQITITFKIPQGKSSAPTFVCNGFLTSFRPGNINSSGLQEAKVKIKWTGTPVATAGAV